MYCRGMLGRLSASLLLGTFLCGRAETLQLKDQASITGKILADKKDQVVVDIGYTVLTVPRSSILKIASPEAAQPAKADADPKLIDPAAKKLPFYQIPTAARE